MYRYVSPMRRHQDREGLPDEWYEDPANYMVDVECFLCGREFKREVWLIEQAETNDSYIRYKRCETCNRAIMLGKPTPWGVQYDTSDDEVSYFMLPVGVGWKKIIWELDDELSKLDPDYSIAQVKEKFGGLRYYINGIDVPYEVYGPLIDYAEAESYKTCEECGEPGIIRDDLAWLKTLCDKHYNQRALPDEVLVDVT
jgi:hypothetical protein